MRALHPALGVRRGQARQHHLVGLLELVLNVEVRLGSTGLLLLLLFVSSSSLSITTVESVSVRGHAADVTAQLLLSIQYRCKPKSSSALHGHTVELVNVILVVARCDVFAKLLHILINSAFTIARFVEAIMLAIRQVAARNVAHLC